MKEIKLFYPILFFGKINYFPYSYKNVNYIIINNLNETNPSNVKNGFNSERKFKNILYSPSQISKFNFNSNETIYYKEKDLNDMNTILYSISSNSDNYFSSYISKKNSLKDFTLSYQLKYILNEWNKIIYLKKIITNLIKYQLRNKRNIIFNFWKNKIKGKTIINQILNYKKREILKKFFLIWKDKKKIIDLKYIIRLLIFNGKLLIKGKLLLHKIKIVIFKYVKNKIFHFIEIKASSIKPKYKKSKLIKKIMNSSFDKILEKQKMLKNYISKWKTINNKTNNNFLSYLSIIKLLLKKKQKKGPNNEDYIYTREMIIKDLFNKKIKISLKYYFMKWEKMIKNINYENLINYNSPRIYIFGESLDASLLENKNISIETIPQINNSISDELNLISIINTDKNELLNSNEYTSENNDIVNLKTPDAYMKKSYLNKNNNFTINNFNKIIGEHEKNIENKNDLIHNNPINKDDNKNDDQELLIIKPISFLSLIEKTNKEEYYLNNSLSKPTENEVEELIINPNFLTIFYRPYFNFKRIRTNFEKKENEMFEKLNKSQDNIKFRNNLSLHEDKDIIKTSLSYNEILLEERKNNIPLFLSKIKNTISESFIKYRRNKKNMNQKLLQDNMDLTFKNGQFYTFGSYEQKDFSSNDAISNKNVNINKNINQEINNNLNQYQKDNFGLMNNIKNENKKPKIFNRKIHLNFNKSNEYKKINNHEDENIKNKDLTNMSSSNLTLEKDNQKENHLLYSNRNKQNKYSCYSNRVNQSCKLYNFIYVKRSTNNFYKNKKRIHDESNEILNYSNSINSNQSSYINQSFQKDTPFNNL